VEECSYITIKINGLISIRIQLNLVKSCAEFAPSAIIEIKINYKFYFLPLKTQA